MKIKKTTNILKTLSLVLSFIALTPVLLYANAYSKGLSHSSHESLRYSANPKHNLEILSVGFVGGATIGTIAGAIVGGPFRASAGSVSGMTTGFISAELIIQGAQLTIRYIRELNEAKEGEEEARLNEVEETFFANLEQLKEDVHYYNSTGQYTENLESFLEDVSLAGHTYSEPEIIASIEALSSMNIDFELEKL